MNKLSMAVLFLVCGATTAWALPPFNVEFKEKYIAGNKDEKFIEDVSFARCNVCHDANSKDKKDKNEYGKAIGTILTKAEYENRKANKVAAAQWIKEGLEKAEGLKSSTGETYSERIKAGKLPGG